MNKINKMLFFCFCVFIPFENTQLSAIGGVLTASPAIIFLFLGLLGCLLSIKKVNTKFFILFIILHILSMGYLLYWPMIFPTLDMGFIFDRGVRFFAIIMFYFGAIYYSMRQSEALLIMGGKAISIVILFSLLCNIFFPSLIYNPSFLHANEYFSINRFRGFAFESSSFGFQIICAVFIIAIVYKLNLVFTVLTATALGILSTSKGAVVVLLLSLVIVFLLIKRIAIIYKLILIILSLIIGSFIVKTFLLSSFVGDIENYTSVATRLTVFLLGFKTLISYPLGVSYFGFLPYFYENGKDIMYFIQQHSPFLLIFSEVDEYFQIGAFKSIGTKSTILDLVVFFGWFFVIGLSIFVKKIFSQLRKKGNYILLILSVFTLLANIFFISSLTLYLTPFLIGFITKLSQQE
jgi:hypothetical protein